MSNELYEKILAHANCVIELDHSEERYGSAIEIANYAEGENLAIECTKCNVVILDVDRQNPETPNLES